MNKVMLIFHQLSKFISRTYDHICYFAMQSNIASNIMSWLCSLTDKSVVVKETRVLGQGFHQHSRFINIRTYVHIYYLPCSLTLLPPLLNVLVVLIDKSGGAVRKQGCWVRAVAGRDMSFSYDSAHHVCHLVQVGLLLAALNNVLLVLPVDQWQHLAHHSDTWFCIIYSCFSLNDL